MKHVRRTSIRLCWRAVWVALGLITAFFVVGRLSEAAFAPIGVWTGLIYVKVMIEVVASVYAAFYFLAALHYRRPEISSASIPNRNSSDVAVLYLCANDFDSEAFNSILTHCRSSGARILIHDDSDQAASIAEVNRTVEMYRHEGYDVAILRRPDLTGGKPAALNNVIANLPPEVEYLLICDSDSIFYRPDLIDRLLSHFDNPQLALVQCRNIGHFGPEESATYQSLSRAVSFYDVFVYFMDRFGWSPFLGHNAMLRVSAIRDVGGFTPGQLADDIDFSIKLRLRGHRIRYAQELECGERHPLTYAALRKRTAKWAYGCTQILLRWGWQVLKNARLTMAEKMTFVLSVCYYHFQILLLIYLIIFYLILPFTERGPGFFELIFSAGLILFLTFVPSLSYFRKERRLADWPKVVLRWGLIYGSQDFVILRAVAECLLGFKMKWTPTNVMSGRVCWKRLLPEIVTGSVILVVAFFQNPSLLLLPTTALFAGKFVLTPFHDFLWRTADEPAISLK